MSGRPPRWRDRGACRGAYLFVAAALGWSLGEAALSMPAVAASEGCRVRPRIIGGVPAASADWPGFAALRLRDEAAGVSVHFCGGTAIAGKWILTAAHCFDDIEGTWRSTAKSAGDFRRVQLEVVLGVDDLDVVSEDNVHAVEQVIVHEVYARALAASRRTGNADEVETVAQRTGHDIALVKLRKAWPGPYSRLSISQRTDPQESDKGYGSELGLIVAGFGAMHSSGKDFRLMTRSNGERFFASATNLREATLSMVTLSRCQEEWRSAKIGKGQMCAGFEKVPGNPADSCSGDSGGPLVILDGKDCSTQVGIVSWGPWPCAPEERAYGVYTRVSFHASWILKHVKTLGRARAAH